MGRRAETIQAQVLGVLEARRTPLSAYDILDALKTDERSLAPTTIYRALSALTEKKAVHRLESRNAFVARQTVCDASAAVLSICDECGLVEETMSKDVFDALSDAARETGFAPKRHVVEVLGRCASCEPDGDGSCGSEEKTR